MRGYRIIKKVLFVFSVVLICSSGMLAQPEEGWNSVLADTTVDNLKIIFGDSSQGFIVNDAGKVFTLADSMDTWTLKDANVPIFALGVDIQNSLNDDDTVAVVVGKQGKVAATTNNGNSWNLVNTGTTNDLNAIQFGWCPTTKESWAYAIGDNSTIRVSKDGGNTWTGQSTPYQFDHFYDLFFYNNEVGWIVGSTGIAYHTVNSGANWGYLEVNQSNPDYYGVNFISPTEGWVCGTGGYIGKTSNGGNNWTQQNSVIQVTLNDIIFNPIDRDTVDIPTPPAVGSILNSNKIIKTLSSVYRGIVVGNHGTALQTTDGGNTWTSINLGTSANLNDVTVDADGYFWIVGDNGTIFNNRPKATIPVAPSGLTSTAISSSQINLGWTDNSDDETGFIIERKIGPNGTWADADTMAANVTEHHDTGLNSNTYYYYRIAAYNSAGKSSYSNETYAVTLESSPNAPSNLLASVVSSSQINLSWMDNSYNESGFILERKTGSNGDWNDADSIDANVTTYQDKELLPNTEYYYRISSYNSNGESSYSNEVHAKTLDTSPNAPTNLTAVAVSSSQINLLWVDNSNNETGFKLERKIGSNGDWNDADSLVANVTSYHDTELSPNTEYYYRISSYNSNGESSYSNEVHAKTSDTMPIAPSNLTAVAISGSQINLTWMDNSNNETGFRLDRKKDQSASSDLLPINQDATSYSDNNLLDGTKYIYKIVSYNSTGNSDYSNETFAITNLNPPTELTIKMLLNNSVQLEWNDNSQSETGFTIERKEGTNSYLKLADVTANVTSYEDTSIPGGYEYSYKVKTFNGITVSEYSNEVSAIISDVLSEGLLPTKYSLYQNYPNPFNPSTNIKFDISKSGRYSLRVYNIVGQQISVLTDREFAPGFYTINFDATNLASGIYFYHLYGDGISLIKKMILLE